MSKNETAAVVLALLLAATSLPSPANDQVGQGAKRPRPRYASRPPLADLSV